MAQISKFFRVATEGATTDGRAITRQQIDQMAKNFNPSTYGARVWLEHLRGIYPDSAFRAYGDVTALEARDVDGGKRALYAQIKPLPDLVAMNKTGQKIYTSIEIHPKFADTGEAYLTGLGVTDSPASLGTDVLTFAAQKPDASPFSKRKSHAEALFSEAVEAALEFEDEPAPTEATGGKFADTIRALVERMTGKSKTDDSRFADVLQGLQAFAAAAQTQSAAHDALAKDHAKLAKDFAALSTKHDDLIKQLETTPAVKHNQRQVATGATGGQQTDC